MKFADLGLSDELLQAVETAGYSEPTPIQAQAIPQVQMMRDVIAVAQTGTGKTASFVLPMIDILASGRRRARMPRSLILEPTRELAAQVAENFEKYGKNHNLSLALLIGGVQMGDQVKRLDEGVDVLIATPGRLMDLFERGKILLTGCDLLVIDEADRMLDMGFIPDIEFICTKLPANRQTLLFSATMPGPIKRLADKFLTNPKHIEVARPATANENIAQHKVFVSSRKKRDALLKLLRIDNVGTAIIFANRKTTVRDLAKSLKRDGFSVGEIHGDMDQSSRIAELNLFKSGEINILVASDVAARGLDIKGVSHIFNYDTPWHPDDYIHRIGRTGRAGAKGRAFTFVTPEDAEAIANVEKLTRNEIPVFDVDGGSGDRAEEPRKTESRSREPRKREPRRAEPRNAEPRAESPKPEPDEPREPRRSTSELERKADEEAPRPRRSRVRRSSSAERKAEPETESKAETRRDVRPESKAEPKSESRPAPQPEPVSEAAPAETGPADVTPADKAETQGEKGGWNGPVPGFLGVKLG